MPRALLSVLWGAVIAAAGCQGGTITGNLAGCSVDCGAYGQCVSGACACDRGFEVEGGVCVDVDECGQGLDDCDPSGICTNELGGFACACAPGYEGDGLTCADVDECAEGLADCSPRAGCTNLPGRFECACNPGYVGDGVACVDMDECVDGTDDCDPNATCTNRAGAYDCACNPGYDGNGVVCADIDECTSGTAGCDQNATCANRDGGFECACVAGFRGDGQVCEDIDECAESLDNCAQDAACANRAGGFECACNQGFEGDGLVCSDIDECAAGTAGCDANATCANSAGSFSCTCDSGFTGDGFTCVPAFDIELVFAQAPSTAVRQAFERAERRWEELIVGDLPAVRNAPSECASVAGTSSVDDLVIRVDLRSIDGPGRILGQAGPTCVRNVSGGDFLPFVGQMRFDTADVATLLNQGRFEAVVLHEMGHVLGIGPAWPTLSLLRNPSCGASGCVTGRDTRYRGTEGNAAWRSLGGTGEAPVENARGPGSSDSHWREDGPLQEELMSPILSSVNSLSVLSLRSLADLGYQVAPNSRADPFNLAPLLAGPPLAPLSLEGDALPGPVLELMPDGSAEPLR